MEITTPRSAPATAAPTTPSLSVSAKEFVPSTADESPSINQEKLNELDEKLEEIFSADTNVEDDNENLEVNNNGFDLDELRDEIFDYVDKKIKDHFSKIEADINNAIQMLTRTINNVDNKFTAKIDELTNAYNRLIESQSKLADRVNDFAKKRSTKEKLLTQKPMTPVKSSHRNLDNSRKVELTSPNISTLPRVETFVPAQHGTSEIPWKMPSRNTPTTAPSTIDYMFSYEHYNDIIELGKYLDKNAMRCNPDTFDNLARIGKIKSDAPFWCYPNWAPRINPEIIDMINNDNELEGYAKRLLRFLDENELRIFKGVVGINLSLKWIEETKPSVVKEKLKLFANAYNDYYGHHSS